VYVTPYSARGLAVFIQVGNICRYSSDHKPNDVTTETFLREVRTRTANVGFEVLTFMVMETSIFWDITPCSPLKVN
jgi:hypothetical protein